MKNTNTSPQEHDFELFLKMFIPQAAEKRQQHCEALWLLETTNSADAAALAAQLGAEEQLLYEDKAVYQQLLQWEKDPSIKNLLLERQLYLLTHAFKNGQAPKDLIEELSKKETLFSQTYGGFRPSFEGTLSSENAILDIFKHEIDPLRRQKAWHASKLIGDHLAPHVLELVTLRNNQAKSLGYANYFQMKLEIEEVDEAWLVDTFENLIAQSESAYTEVLQDIEKQQEKRFGVKKEELGPWSWSDPFCQNDPLDDGSLDGLVSDIDIVTSCERYFHKMGFHVKPVLERSDLWERPGKNQHAFCINIDRLNDVRVLANIKPYLNWLDGLLHELGHVVYEIGFDSKLPWLLRCPPSGIATEAIALLMNRQAYRYHSLKEILIDTTSKEPLMRKAEESFKRRQLILSRFIVVLTYFERELYRNPNQDLNHLWWSLVHKYQKVPIPKGREGKNDWSAKIHIGLAPVYAFSYLLGELFASSIEESLLHDTKSSTLGSEKVGEWLQRKVFSQGNRLNWNELVEFATGKRLNADAWIRQFC